MHQCEGLDGGSSWGIWGHNLLLDGIGFFLLWGCFYVDWGLKIGSNKSCRIDLLWSGRLETRKNPEFDQMGFADFWRAATKVAELRVCTGKRQQRFIGGK